MNKNEIRLKEANINDVDLILDMKLDIILNKPYIVNLNKSELERKVLEAEEQIRENLQEYKMISLEDIDIGFISIIDLDNIILIDSMYILNDYRNNGIAKYVIKEIINTNFKPINIWIDKENIKLINICKNIGFINEEESEDKIYMKCENEKEENTNIKAKILCNEVAKLCEKYNVNYFFYTENRSVSNIKNKENFYQINTYIKKEKLGDE